MKTAIVILNWNGRKFLESYLPSVISSLEGDADSCVVVADNASTDDSISFLKENYPDVRVIQLKKNYGFAEGYNKALEHVEADYFLLLNSDVEVPQGWLYPLVEWMDLHEDCGICGPKLHQMEQRDMFEYAGAAGGYIDKFGYPLCRGRVMKMIEQDKGQYDIPSQVMWVSGAALMIRSRVFRSLKGFSKDFFAHMEEIDLCWRARLDGWKVCIVPRSVVYHVGGGSLPQDSPRKLQLNYRNNLLMLEHNLSKTFAVNIMFSFLKKGTLPDEGPDIFSTCADVYCGEDQKFKDEMCNICASAGYKYARHLIFRRMILDGLSAMVYLCTGRIGNFKAVWNAHRQYRKLKRKHTVKKASVKKYLQSLLEDTSLSSTRIILTEPGKNSNFGIGDFKCSGMWNKWVVWESVFHKKEIFQNIKDNIV